MIKHTCTLNAYMLLKVFLYGISLALFDTVKCLDIKL